MAAVPSLLLITGKVVPTVGLTVQQLLDEVEKQSGLTVQIPAATFVGGYTQLTVPADAVVGVLTEALDRSSGKPAAELKDTKRSGMRVHARKGQPCPVCGDVVREVSFASKSLQYCATCQTGGKPLADRRLSRLLK